MNMLHETAEAETRGIAGGVGGTSSNVTQRKCFTDTGAAAARVAGAAADGICTNVVTLEIRRHSGVF